MISCKRGEVTVKGKGIEVIADLLFISNTVKKTLGISTETLIEIIKSGVDNVDDFVVKPITIVIGKGKSIIDLDNN